MNKTTKFIVNKQEGYMFTNVQYMFTVFKTRITGLYITMFDLVAKFFKD